MTISETARLVVEKNLAGIRFMVEPCGLSDDIKRLMEQIDHDPWGFVQFLRENNTIENFDMLSTFFEDVARASKEAFDTLKTIIPSGVNQMVLDDLKDAEQ